MVKNHSRFIAPVLGALGAIGPLATDLYLPVLPAIAADLGAGEGALQLSLMTFFAGIMIGQLLFGPLSDRLGRKPIIYAGMLVFGCSSLGCALSDTAGQLVAWRLLQGMGGSIGMVVGLAMVRDLYTGRAASSLLGLMMAVQGIAPIIAPALGTAITAFVPWQTLFFILTGFALFCMVLTALILPETRSAELRTNSRLSAVLHNYLGLFANRHYLSFNLVCALVMGGFFAYLAGSSFVFIAVHGISPAAYSAIFATNALGLMAGAQLSSRLARRWRPVSIIRFTLALYFAAGLLLTVLEWLGLAHVVVLSVLLFVVVTMMAFVRTLGSVLAMETVGAIAGTAAALLGALGFGAGALAAFLVGAFANGSGLPMAATIAVCGLLGCLVAAFMFPGAGDRNRKSLA